MRRIAIGVVVAAMVLAACGSSNSKNSVAASGGSSTTAANSGSTTGSTSGGSGGNSDFSALAGQYAKAKIKITYTSGTDTFTFAQDGNGKSSYGSGNDIIYTDGKTTVSCTGSGTTAKCIDAGNLGAAAGGIGASLSTTFAALATAFTRLKGGDSSSETIAGRDATCETYTAADAIGQLATIPLFKDSGDKASDYDPTDKATICLDKDTGFVVKVAGTKKGVPQDSLTATPISEPSDSDFTPPVTPQTLPSISLPSVSLPGGGSVP